MIKRIVLLLVIVFLAMNVIAYFHASKFTHFNPDATVKTKDASELSFPQKIKTAVVGVSNPRPVNRTAPSRPYTTITLNSNKKIECWLMKAKHSKGTVIVCHGYSGNKSSMLDKAAVFMDAGYSTLLLDFMGSGGSEGNRTTIGFYEAEEVKTAFEYLQEQGETRIFLFGTSMGAAAVMKAVHDHQLAASAIIIECPFGTLLETVEARFTSMHLPCFPMANLLVYWGGKQNDFDGFAHNPVEYAEEINCPTLLLYGQKDEKVCQAETDAIFNALKGTKQLKMYPDAAHENYLKKYKKEWTADVSGFMATVDTGMPALAAEHPGK